MKDLHLLAGGAANGLVSRMAPQFTVQTGLRIAGTFSAVGQMKDALLAGAPCDLIILSQALIRELSEAGKLEPGSERAIGTVKTGMAVPAGQAAPAVGDEASLKRALESASAIYVPHLTQSTAGIHFMKVLRSLGLEQALGPRVKAFANGQTAMATMASDARAGQTGLLGSTQVTEILNTEGVQLAGLLPPSLELATVYTAAVVRDAPNAAAARQLIGLLAAPEAGELRRTCGFS
jgi:molybdate transport system substrate-binding protein